MAQFFVGFLHRFCRTSRICCMGQIQFNVGLVLFFGLCINHNFCNKIETFSYFFNFFFDKKIVVKELSRCSMHYVVLLTCFTESFIKKKRPNCIFLGPDFWTTLNELLHHTTANVAQKILFYLGYGVHLKVEHLVFGASECEIRF